MEPESALLVPGEEKASAILHNCEPYELCDQSVRQDGPCIHRCNSVMTVVEENDDFVWIWGCSP